MPRTVTPLERLRGLHSAHPGAAPRCRECGLEDLRHADDDPNRYDAANEPHFSWRGCDACSTRLGGDRHPAHALDEHGTWHHLNVCHDCYLALAGYAVDPKEE